MILGRGVFQNTAASTFMWHTIYMPSFFIAVAIAMTLVFIIHVLILTYHWFRYGLNKAVASLSFLIYVSVGLFLLFFLVGASIALS